MGKYNKKKFENIPQPIISTKNNNNIYKYETSQQHKPDLKSVSTNTDIVSNSSLGLNREIENNSLPSLPTSPTPYNSTTEPILTNSDCECLDPNKSTLTLNKKTSTAPRKRKAKAQLSDFIKKKKKKRIYLFNL